jgi:putative transposase
MLPILIRMGKVGREPLTSRGLQDELWIRKLTMPSQTILRTVEFKLYLNSSQEITLTEWLAKSCWLYNQCLEQRIKAYKRRGESVGYNQQCELLTGLRERIPELAAMPVAFERSALQRLDRGFAAFFRRVKAGQKPGFPRFHSRQRYNSLEYLAAGNYVRGDKLYIPKLGLVRMRAGDQDFTGKQKLLRIIRRPTGWYGQVVLDTGIPIPEKVPVQSAVGIDMGLTHFLTTSSGEKIANPRCFRKSAKKLKRAQQKVCRRVKGSKNRRKAVKRLARIHERIKAQRRDFAHQQARKLVNKYDLIGFEDLNIKGLAAGMLAKSVNDAAWGMFLGFLACKAESAGKHGVPVDPRGTSQECPFCGKVVPKLLSERVHRCECRSGTIDRDHASGLVVLFRALRVVGATACGEFGLHAGDQTGACQLSETGSSASTGHYPST